MRPRAAWFVFRVLLLVVALTAACAHLPTVVGACDPVVSEVAAIVAAFGPADWKARIDKYIADGHAACKVAAAIDQLLNGQSLTKAGDESLSESTLDHMRAWRLQHPG